MKCTKFQHFHLLKGTKFRPHPFHLRPRPSDLAKSMQKDMNFSTFQRMHSMTPSERHEIQNVKGSIFVYQMGGLCGGAHEISGIKAPIFLRGWGW